MALAIRWDQAAGICHCLGAVWVLIAVTRSVKLFDGLCLEEARGCVKGPDVPSGILVFTLLASSGLT